MKSKRTQLFWENLAVFVLAATAVSVTIAKAIGMLPDALLLPAVLTLLVPLSWLVLRWLIWRRETTDKIASIDDKLLTVINLLDGVVEPFGDLTLLYRYLETRVHNATSWKILTFSPYQRDEGRGTHEKIQYQIAMQERVAAGKLKVNRTCAIWNREHIDHLVERMKTYEGLPYHVACTTRQGLPMLNMIIIDDAEVLIWLFQTRDVVRYDPGGFRVTHKSVVRSCEIYYSEVWSSAALTHVKDYRIDWAAVAKIRELMPE